MKKTLFKISTVAIVLLMVTMGCKKDTDIKVSSVSLNETNIALTVDGTATLTATIYPEDATNKTVSWTSSKPDVATVANGVVTAKEVGKTTITVITEDGKFKAECIVSVTPEWVEIYGVKWARRNVDMPGTFAAKPEDAGMFYQWNRKIAWSSTDPMVNSDGGTTWDESNPDGTTWEKQNDPCPAGWRVPTVAELESLKDTESQWTTVNNVIGRIFGLDDQTLFLPAAGHRCAGIHGNLRNVDTIGYYWSSSTDDNSYNAFNLGLSNTFVHFSSSSRRIAGFSVRCVAD